MITKRSISKPNSIEEFGEIAISKKKPKFLLLASTIQFSNHHAPHDPTSHPGPATTHGHRTAPQKTCGVAVREPKSIPIPLPDGTNPIQADRSLPHQHPHARPWNHSTGTGLTPDTEPCPEILRRKEVIQPHLPVRLPCYDLVPITSLTLDGSPQKGWATGFGCYPLS